MRVTGKSKKVLAISFVIFIMLSLLLISNSVAADTGLNMPSTPVRIEVSNGAESYFNTKLTDVPSGYDVTNGTYFGWCVDIRAEMARSPATHQVFLYSSIDPPGELADEEWDMVNYILNHKQGAAQDIQQAIWYFIHMDSDYVPTNIVAWDIINDTLANGKGFIPGYGQTLAVICYPTILFPEQSDVQVSIIEVENTVISEFPSVPVLLLMMLTILFAVIICKKVKLLIPKPNATDATRAMSVLKV